MKLISKEKALSFLEKTIKEGDKLNFHSGADCKTWARNVRVRTEAIFGKKSEQVEELAPQLNNFDFYDTPYKRGLYAELMVALLKSFHTEIAELWSDEGVEETVEPIKDEVKDECAEQNSYYPVGENPT